MTLFNPVWRVTIGGVQYQTAILANLTITSGRTNIYEQAQAGYTNLEIINLDQSNVAIQINDSITIELQDSTATFVPIFGGSVVEVGIAVAEVGSVDYAQRINIIALGALARLPKALTEGVLSDDFDGDQIYTILKEVLFLSWQEVPAALTWATYDPTTQWQDAENSGLGEIDRPGNYELENRGSSVTQLMFIHWYQLWQHRAWVTFTKMHKVKFPMLTAHTEPIIWPPMGMLILRPTMLWHRA
jgi:hypothetical protein